MKRSSLIDKIIACAVTAALVIVAPGFGCYEAAAQMYNSGAAGNAAAGGQAGSAVGAIPVGAVVVPLTNVSAPISIGLSGLSAAPVVSVNPALNAAPGASAFLALSAARGAAVNGVAVGQGASLSPSAQRSRTDPEPMNGTRNLENLSGQLAPAAGGTFVRRIAKSMRSMLSNPRSVAPQSVEIGRMAGAQAHDAGSQIMDRVLGTKSIASSASEPVVAGVQAASQANGLVRHAPNSPSSGGLFRRFLPSPAAPGAPAPKSVGSRVMRIAGSLAWVAAGVAVAIGAQAAAVALAPAVFGLIPGAALWAVLSGIVIGPVGLYFRYRLSLRDSARLKGPKRLFDVSLGLLAGAAVIALPGIITGAVFLAPAVAIPATVISFGTLFALAGGETHLKSGLLAVGSTAILAASAAAFGPFTLGGLFGLVALPAITTMAFFLGRIVSSAETGRPFSIPGALQQIRFPLYTWVMTGVVFALLTGYTPFWVNAVFAGWMFLGNKKLFNYAYLGAAAFAIVTGLTSPVTFFVIAFLPERAAVWTEALLGRMLKAGQAAPSSDKQGKLESNSVKPTAWPKYHYMLQTVVFLGTLAGFAAFLGFSIVGVGSILTNTAVAAAMAFIPLFFAKKLIKMMMKAEPTTEEQDPVVHGIMKELRERINAERAAKNQKPIPMPEIVNIPAAAMPVPNAFATGFSPFSALVGVTEVFKKATLDPEELRAGLVRMLGAVDPQSNQYKVFRLAISQSIPGTQSDAGPQVLIQSVRNATTDQLKHLGYRAMRGVLGHEFNHVMHRDMVLGAIAGAQSSGISFASYGVLWAVGHARYVMRKVIDWIRGKTTEPSATPPSGSSARSDDEGTRNLGGVKPEFVEPVTTGLAIKTIFGLAKVFVALWAPIIAQLLQMGSSRTREAHADEGGALLTEDPASLALGLGLLMAWRPAPGFSMDRRRMPFVAALQHLFTVNPGEQLLEAGQLASSGRFEGRPVEKADNAFFNLFITHPDTNERIGKLYDMALAIEAKKRSGGGGSSSTGSRTSDGTRNLGGVGPQARHPKESPLGLLRHDDSGEAPEGLVAVDGDTDEGLSAPGLDGRLVRIVDVMRQEIDSDVGKRRRLGHLLAALENHLAVGGVVRFTGLAANGQMVPSHFDPAAKALYLNQMLQRSSPKLQAALLAAQLQEVYDREQGRMAGTKEAAARQVTALDLFLEGTDMREVAEGIDINNPVEVSLFESQLEQRQWAAAGSAAFEQVFGQLSSVPQMLQKARDQASLLERQMTDIKDELGLVRAGLARGRDAELSRQERVLEERERILGGSITLARTQLDMLDRETEVSGGKLETPLAVPGGAAATATSPWRVVPVKAKATIDPRLAEPVALIKNIIASSKDPAIRALAPVVATLERLTASGGRVTLAPPGQDAAAYFSPVTLDLVVGAQFANTHPALVAAMMVHELTHALDYFEGRPLTRETEKNAFTNEAIFAGAFDPREIAAALDVRNPMEQSAYQLIYHARARYVEGNTSLQSMISEAYRTLFGTHFEGLQTASQLLEETVRSRLEPLQAVHAQLIKRGELIRGAMAGGDAMRKAQYEALQRTVALTEAHLRLLERQVEQLQTIQGSDDEPAAKPRGPGQAFGSRKPLGLFPAGFGPKLGLSTPRAPRANAIDARGTAGLENGIPRDGPSAIVAASPSPVLDPRIGGRAASRKVPGILAHADSHPPALGPPVLRPEGEKKPGLLRGAWRRFIGLLHVLPDEGRNKEFWKFVLIQALLTVGVSFHYTALPGLIAPRQEDSSRLGVNRAVNWGSQAASNLLTGPIVDRASVQAVLIGTHLGRAVLLIAVPFMFFAWRAAVVSLPWAGAFPAFILAFLVVIGLHGFLQATSITAGTVAFNRILGPNPQYYSRANAVYNIVVSIIGVAAPLAAGFVIGALDKGFGVIGAGNALVYSIYGLMLGAAAAGFMFLKLPRDPVLQARRGLAVELKANPPAGPKVKGVAAREEDGLPVLLVEVRGDPAQIAGAPAAFEGYAVRFVPERRVMRELAEGFRVLWSIRFLRLTLAFSTLNLLVSDSIVFTVLPQYIKALGVASVAEAFGMYLAAGALGVALASAFVALRRPDAYKARASKWWDRLMRPLDRLRESQTRKGMDSLDRSGWWTGLLYGVASLFYWLVFFSPSLWVSLGAMLAISTLQGAAMVVWPALYQKVLTQQRPHDMGKAYAAMYFYQLLLSVVGVLVFGALMTAIPLAVALWLVGGLMTVVALLQFVEIGVLFPSNRR